jgi:hypothetical protein
VQQDIDFVTLHQWFNKFNVAGMKEVYLKPPPGVKNARGSAFCLELFIHEDIVSFLFHIYIFPTFINIHFPQYFERTGDNDEDEIDELLSKSKKRKGSKGHKENSQVSKRVKGVFILD